MQIVTRRQLLEHGLSPIALLGLTGAVDVEAFGNEPEEIDAARAVLREFNQATNRGDTAALRASCSFPHIRLARGSVAIYMTPQEWPVEEMLKEFQREGRAYGVHDKVDMVQHGPDKVHAAITFSRHHADGTKYATYETLWIVTRQNGHWGIQCRSSFAG